MKRKFHQFDTNFYIDLSAVIHIKVAIYNKDYHEVVVRGIDRQKLWEARFTTAEDAHAYAKDLIKLMEEIE